MNVDQTLRESTQSTKPIAAAVVDKRSTLIKLMARLNIESIRVSVLHRFSHNLLNSWSLGSVSDQRNYGDKADSDNAQLESPELDYKFRISDPGQTKTRQLSPHLWSLIWLDGAEQLVTVRVRYTEPREFVDEKDAALVRLLCLNLTQEKALETKLVKPDSIEGSHLSSERQPSFRLLSSALVLMLCISALLAGWLAIFGTPAADREQFARQTETSRLQTMADLVVIEHLSKALAAGDYGDLQDDLSGFYSMGFYQKGIVVNAAKRVIAAVGDGNVADIGQSAPETLPSTIRSVPLKSGNEELGYFIYPQRPAPSEITPFFGLRNVAAASALAAFFAAVFFLLFLRRRRISLPRTRSRAKRASSGDKKSV